MVKRDRNMQGKLRRDLQLGTVCANCGKECGRDIEYHHIVPLECGGRDVITNFVPLCCDCHSLITHGHVRKRPTNQGRHRRVYDAIYLDYVFTKYVQGEISEKKAREMLGTGNHIRDMAHFKEWAEQNGIDTEKHLGRGGNWRKDDGKHGWHIKRSRT